MMFPDTILRAQAASELHGSYTRSGTDCARIFAGFTVSRRRATLSYLIGGYGIVSLWCLSSTGCCSTIGAFCPTWGHAYRTTIVEPAAYSPNCDRRTSLELYSTWADQAWREQSGACGASITERAYAAGFHDGFVDYVYAGGTGEPPPVPPRRFWNAMYRSGDGRQQANQWFEGFRHGARVARDQGYRERATVQASTAYAQNDSQGVSDRRETSPFGDDDSFPSPAGVNAVPGAAARTHDKQPVAPPPSTNEPEAQPEKLVLPPANEPEARPAEWAPSTTRPTELVPPSNGAAPQNPMRTVPQEQPPIPPPATEPKPGTSKIIDRQPLRSSLSIRPQPTKQQAPSPSKSTHEPARQTAVIRPPSTIAESSVHFVSGSTNNGSNSGTNTLTPVALLAKRDNPDKRPAARVVTCAAELPAPPPAVEHAAANPDNPFDANVSPLSTPCGQTTSALLFGR